jgi:polysaccharide deacetylase 2 family uncharacterized protein YibQ
VLDDWGYSPRNVALISQIRSPLTLAVLPHLPYSNDVARRAAACGHEVILHMPMEALDPHAPREPQTIRVGMSSAEIATLLDRALQSVPTAVGISNHQGSKATADRTLMEEVLRQVKHRRLYFLDSYVTKRSVCREVAQRLKVPFVQRSVFLDNEETSQAIFTQLLELAQRARRKGWAIGIGHDRPETLEALQQAIPALKQAGYTLVRVSELLDVDSASKPE